MVIWTQRRKTNMGSTISAPLIKRGERDIMGRKWTEEQKQAKSEEMKKINAEKRDEKITGRKNVRSKRYPQGEFAYYKFFNQLDPGHAFWGRYNGQIYACEHGEEIRMPVSFANEMNETLVPTDTPTRVKVNHADIPQGIVVSDVIVNRKPRFEFVKIREDDK
jgi:hypothetical protein